MMTSLLSHFQIGARTWGALLAAGTLTVVSIACSDTSTSTRSQINGNSGAGATTSTSSNNGNNAVSTATTGGIIVPMTTGSTGAGGTTMTECDATGVNCTCIKVAVMGRLGDFGAVPGMDSTAAMDAWLNDNSNGDAATFLTKPALTAEFLGEYDVLILQALETAPGAAGQWAITPEETAAVETWVRAGGGIISLTGYSDQPAEATTTNNLLAFSGLKYAGLTGPGDTAGDTQVQGECDYCLGNSKPTVGWNAAHPISANVSAVGAFWGRSVSAPPNAAVVAQSGNIVYGATVEIDAGRVFMFHDEWVTYTSQWDGTGLIDDCRVQENVTCQTTHPTLTYQLAQFWYNSLRWVSNRECFDITNPEIEIIK